MSIAPSWFTKIFVTSAGNISSAVPDIASPSPPAIAPSAAPLTPLATAVDSLSPLIVLFANFKKKPIAAPLKIPPLANASTDVIAPIINALLAGLSFANPPHLSTPARIFCPAGFPCSLVFNCAFNFSNCASKFLTGPLFAATSINLLISVFILPETSEVTLPALPNAVKFSPPSIDTFSACVNIFCISSGVMSASIKLLYCSTNGQTFFSHEPT